MTNKEILQALLPVLDIMKSHIALFVTANKGFRFFHITPALVSQAGVDTLRTQILGMLPEMSNTNDTDFTKQRTSIVRLANTYAAGFYCWYRQPQGMPILSVIGGLMIESLTETLSELKTALSL
jgi:hypothetical protein